MAEPLRPYPKYRDSGVPWLGKIPEHWEVRRLKQVAQLNPSKSEIEKAIPEHSQITFLAMEQVSADGRIDATKRRSISEAWNGFTYFRKGDVIVAKITPCFENGKGACLDKLPTEIGFGSTEFVVLRSRSSMLPRFLYRATTMPEFRRLGADAMIGAAGQQRVPLSFIGNFPVTLPPLSEQAAIVRYLDHVDRRIRRCLQAKRRQIKLLEEYKRAVIHRAVTRGLNPAVRLKSSGVDWLGEIPEHWEVRRLRQCGNILGGMTPSMEILRYWGGDVPWVTPKDMKKLILNDSSMHVTVEALNETGLRIIDPPAVLIVVRGMILARLVPIALTTNSVTINQDMKALIPHPGVEARFLSLLLDSSRDAFTPLIDEAGHGTRRLPTERWREILLALPPLPEQNEIVIFIHHGLTKYDKVINKSQSQISLLLEFRASLISDAVTGQVDLRRVAEGLADEPVEELEALEEPGEEGAEDLAED